MTADVTADDAKTAPPPPLDPVAQTLGALCNLIIDAGRAENIKALNFRILNNTIHLIHYERALLWDMERYTLMGVSGHVEVSQRTKLVLGLKPLIKRIKDPEKAGLLTGERIDRGGDAVAVLEKLPVMWLPIICHGRLVAGLWLERAAWEPEKELEILKTLADGYGAVRERFVKKKNFLTTFLRRKLVLLFVLAVIVSGLFCKTMPLRLVAPCNVIAEDPFIVTAPMDGVVKKLMVMPGDKVKKGDRLFVYDQQLSRQDLEIARREIEEVKAQLVHSTALAFSDSKELTRSRILKLRLQQEELKLALAKHIVKSQVVVAQRDGVVMVTHPHEWRARPVKTGERVLTLIDPEKTILQIWLAQNDNIHPDRNRPVDVFLLAEPHTSHLARITYIAPDTANSPTGVPSFMVEAAWTETKNRPHPGLKGTAVIYGPKKTVAYWIFRKPWAAARKFFGY